MLAILIVNWNKKDDVLTLLDELAQLTIPLFDIFVVDNASTDNSVTEIKIQFPNTILIQNQHNLGGTGGFNTGLKKIVKLNKYNYIWLLDNDAKIKTDTVTELIKVLDNNPKIGIAGSTIVDIDNKVMVVETGSNFRWDMVGVVPKNRNIKITNSLERIIEVDYVAICSALVRIDALIQIGLMDERLFLFWDDMDWGMYFKQYGYKVVAVTTSIAYHASFTEKDRGFVTNLYYGIRNPLLVYSKHTIFLKRLPIFYRTLRYYLRIYYFLKQNNKAYAKIIRFAFSDFLKNNWGKYSATNIRNGNYKNNYQINTAIKNPNILVSAVATGLITLERMIKQLKEIYPDSDISILVTHDRVIYFKEYSTILLNTAKAKNFLYNLKLFFKIYKKQFTFFAASYPLPFKYAVNFEIEFNNDGELIGINKTGIKNIKKLFFSIIYSEINALCLLPKIMYKSQQYHNQKNERNKL